MSQKHLVWYRQSFVIFVVEAYVQISSFWNIIYILHNTGDTALISDERLSELLDRHWKSVESSAYTCVCLCLVSLWLNASSKYKWMDTENNMVLLMDVRKERYWDFNVRIVKGKCVQCIDINIDTYLWTQTLWRQVQTHS